MTKQERQQVLLAMKDTAEGRALKDFLDEELARLNEIETIEGEVSLEARKEAKKILKKLFSFFYETGERAKKSQYE